MLAFVLSLLVVTFLHLVVGEMAPKSWAISHPEWSATLLALPMRAFMWFTRPLLVALNSLANRCLRTVGVEPVDEVGAGRTPDDLREPLDYRRNIGPAADITLVENGGTLLGLVTMHDLLDRLLPAT